MKEYHKIQTVYFRDPETNHKTLLNGVWATPEFGYLSAAAWTFTEKVDGTNIRVIWDGEKVTFRGKTDRAQLYPGLLEALEAKFPTDLLGRVLSGPLCLYGEGYGEKIQKGGGRYKEGQDFVLFDAYAGMWFERIKLEELAHALKINIVPIIGTGTLVDMVEITKKGFTSTWGDFVAEGIVARPAVELISRRGDRIITKVKHKDFR